MITKSVYIWILFQCRTWSNLNVEYITASIISFKQVFLHIQDHRNVTSIQKENQLLESLILFGPRLL